MMRRRENDLRITDYRLQISDLRSQISNLGSTAFALLIFSFAFASAAAAQIASGGAYTLEKSVTSAGGAPGAGGAYTIEGSVGQFGVGAAAQSAPFTLHPGFWTPAPLAPTAASVTLAGRVRTIGGRGISGARLTLTGAGGETRAVTSTAFGYYRFENVAAGETYILTISSKRFTFAVPTQIVTLADARDDVDFIAEDN